MRWTIEYQGQEHEVEVVKNGPEHWLVSIDGKPKQDMTVKAGGSGEWIIMTESGTTLRLGASVEGEQVFVQHKGWGIPMRAEDARKANFGLSKAEGAGRVQTQMPGAVVKILVAAGDAVKKGQPVVVVEAMKMENEFKAPHDGIVSNILVDEGQTVDAGAVLLMVEENGEA